MPSKAKPPVEEAAEILSSPGVTKEYIQKVPIAKVHANPWNPNVQDDRTYEATKESIREFGFIDDIISWPHPDIPGEWMTIDGEHRGRASGDEGLQEVDIVVLHGLSPAQARRLTVILNETRGDPDVAKLGKLLSDIEQLAGEAENPVGYGLPYTDSEMRHLLEIGSTDWDEFHRSEDAKQRARQNAATNPDLTVVLIFPDAAGKEKFDTFTSMLLKDLEHDDATVEDAVLHGLAIACKTL